MTSALLGAEITEDDGTSRKLTDEEAVAFIKLLSSAGNETTAKLIGWIGSTLAEFPGGRARLVKEKDLIRNGIEEILRYEPPALCLARVAQREVVLHGEVVPAGGVVIFVQAATGRDPRQFPEPDRLDVARVGSFPRVGRRLGRMRHRLHRECGAGLREATDPRRLTRRDAGAGALHDGGETTGGRSPTAQSAKWTSAATTSVTTPS
jgi:cytochrome P450